MPTQEVASVLGSDRIFKGFLNPSLLFRTSRHNRSLFVSLNHRYSFLIDLHFWSWWSRTYREDYTKKDNKLLICNCNTYYICINKSMCLCTVKSLSTFPSYPVNILMLSVHYLDWNIFVFLDPFSDCTRIILNHITTWFENTAKQCVVLFFFKDLVSPSFASQWFCPLPTYTHNCLVRVSVGVCWWWYLLFCKC